MSQTRFGDGVQCGGRLTAAGGELLMIALGAGQDCLRVAIGGIGTVGMKLARQLDKGIAGLTLSAVSARNQPSASDRISSLRRPAPVVSLGTLAEQADVIVECAPAAVFRQVAEPAVEAGRIFMPISVGALLSNWDLVERARETGARIVVPSGALLGLDAVQAAAEGRIESVRMVTRKPPKALLGSPYIEQHAIDLDQIFEPQKIFDGSARDGAVGFPANVNVAAALALAGVGPDDTRLEIWADPTVDRNIHTIVVEADSARFELKIENVPSDENPRTGKIVVLSVIATLRRLVDTLVIGT